MTAPLESSAIRIVANGYVSALDPLVVLQLVSVDVPNSPSEIGNDASRDGGNGGSRRVEKFSDLNEQEQRHAIGGAVFVACMFGYAAYFRVRRFVQLKNN
jgi:hypothetical protein